MKFTFETTQLAYLNLVVSALADMPSAPLDAQKVLRKMKYKFTPNASLVFLNGRERKLLDEVLVYRAGQLKHMELYDGEYQLIEGIAGRLGVELS